MSPFVRELTARGRGAIRVLELGGPGALERVQAFPGAKRLGCGDFARVELRDRAGELLDEAIVLVDSAERVELHLHGAPALVERLLRELGAGAWPEGRSLEARAEERLAAAASEAAARVLLDQAQGALRAALEALLPLSGARLRASARGLARAGRVALALVTPPRVVLAGPVNAGKSTLFNVLVGRERVVVHAAAGTTRDPVRERVRLGAYAVELWDTAGEGACGAGEEAAVERAGQGLSAELARGADLVLRLLPPGHRRETNRGDAEDAEEARRRKPGNRETDSGPCERCLRSQADLEPAPSSTLPSLSALRDPLGARAVVERVSHEALALPAEPWRPGAPAPFEPEWVEALETLDGQELLRAVTAWLKAR